MKTPKYNDIVIQSSNIKRFEGDQYALINFGCEVLKSKLYLIGERGCSAGKIMSEWLNDCKDTLDHNGLIVNLLASYFAIDN